MDEQHLQHLVTVLSHTTSDVTVDWAEVAKTRGVTRKGNATRDFKAMMKKYGIDYTNNKFSLIGGSTVADTTSENKAKSTTPRKRKPKATEEDASEGEGESESASPKKKQKGKKGAEVEKEVEKDTASDEDD